MQHSNKVIAIVTLVIIASSPAQSEESRGFYTNEFTGNPVADEQDLLLTGPAKESLAASLGYRFNSRFGLEGYYAELNQKSLLAERGQNLYNQNLLGSGLADSSLSSVSGVSAVTRFNEGGTIRPFTRMGLHRYDIEGYSGRQARGDSLLFGAGADITMPLGWNAKLQWERYSDFERQDLNLFSADFEFKF